MSAKKIHQWLIILTAGFGLGAFSCASTHVTTWTDPNYRGEQVKKVAVFALVDQPVIRENLEKAMVNRLQQDGTPAVASVDLAPVKDGKDRKKQIDDITERAGADAVLILNGLSVKKQVEYAPSVGINYYDYYWHYRDLMGSSDYMKTAYTTVKVEARLFSRANERLLWAGKTDTYYTRDVKKISKAVANKVVDTLEDIGFVG